MSVCTNQVITVVPLGQVISNAWTHVGTVADKCDVFFLFFHLDFEGFSESKWILYRGSFLEGWMRRKGSEMGLGKILSRNTAQGKLQIKHTREKQ